MQYISILLATSAALVSSQSVPEDYEWNVVNWSAGCARECSYNFNISGPLVPPYPSFTATCSGYDTGAFTNCEVIDASLSNGAFPSVLSLVAPSTGDGAHLQVSLLFTTDDGWVSVDLLVE